MVTLPEPTQEHLLLAVRQSWRPNWPGFPDDPQACIDHPFYGPCMRILARRLGRKQPTSRPAPPTPPSPATAGRWHMPPGAFDARRAAANDRDDT